MDTEVLAEIESPRRASLAELLTRHRELLRIITARKGSIHGPAEVRLSPRGRCGNPQQKPSRPFVWIPLFPPTFWVRNSRAALLVARQRAMNVVSLDAMPNYPHILFNKSPEQLRRQGALGGRALGRNNRARRALMPTQHQTAPPRAAPRETTAEAIVTLNAQFPWLRAAEKRESARRIR